MMLKRSILLSLITVFIYYSIYTLQYYTIFIDLMKTWNEAASELQAEFFLLCNKIIDKNKGKHQHISINTSIHTNININHRIYANVNNTILQQAIVHCTGNSTSEK